MGNCKCCVKPKTSDDVERESEGRQSVREQGEGQRSSIRSAPGRGQRSSIRSISSVAKIHEPSPPPPPLPPSLNRTDPARASAVSIDRNAKNRKSLVDSNGPNVTRISVRSTKGQVQRVAEDVPRSRDLEVIIANICDLQLVSFSTPSHQKLNNGNPIRKKENQAPGNSRPYSAYDDNGKRLMNQLKQKYGFKRDFSLGDICTIMWKEDDHLEFNKHYKFSRNNGLSCNLDPAFLAQHPTYAAFFDLLELHGDGANRNEIQRAEEKFLVEVMETRVMQICWAFLKQNIYSHLGKNDFKNRLRSIWFPDAFEHIFIGYVDEDNKTVKGLHNWLQYSSEFNEGNITYIKCLRQVERMMVVIQYRWNGCLKDSGSMFIGTSPEFELALYTLLYAASLANNQEENDFVCSFEDRKPNGNVANTNHQLIEVKIIVNGNDKSFKTAYPIKMS